MSKLLDLRPGEGPSSTVVLLRQRGASTDIAVLGDSTIVLGRQDGTEVRLSDERLKTVRAVTRRQIHDRLRAGTAYDAAHRDLLADLQVAERGAQNAPGGYWIAEADQAAGHHADVRTYPSDGLRWAVLATDGAQRPVDHLAITWSSIATMDDRRLGEQLHRWESAQDPDGRALPPREAARRQDRCQSDPTPHGQVGVHHRRAVFTLSVPYQGGTRTVLLQPQALARGCGLRLVPGRRAAARGAGIKQ